MKGGAASSGKICLRDNKYDHVAMDHYMRVKQDGGVLPNDRYTNDWLTGLRNAWCGDLRSSLLADSFGILTSSKLNSTAVSKQYAINSAADAVQATAGRQPLLLPFTGRRYFFAGTETCSAALAVNIRTIKELVINLKVVSTATTQCTMGFVLSTADVFALVITRTGTNTVTANWAFGGSNFTDAGLSLTDNTEYYLKLSSASFGSSFVLSKSTNGTSWTTMSIKSFTNFANANSTGFYIGSSIGSSVSYKTNGTATGAQIYGGWYTNYSSVTTTFDFSQFSISNTNTLLSGGLTFSITTKSGTNTGTQLILWPAMYFDGSDNKLQSGTFVPKSGQCTLFALINFGHNLTGTRYFINDSGDKIKVYSDGTNVYVGDSGSVFNMGAVPTGTVLLTFVKNGPLSFAQFNQQPGVTGNGGTLMPTDLLRGGLHANDTSNSATNKIEYALCDGVLTSDQLFYMQTLINNLFKQITSTPIWV